MENKCMPKVYKKKKNKLGFTEKQLHLVLDFCRAVEKNPRTQYVKFHNVYSYYPRKQSTYDLLNKAYRNNVIVGPYLFCNRGIEIYFLDDVKKPLKMLKNMKSDESIIYRCALMGDYNFMYTKYGANILECARTIMPTKITGIKIEDLYFNERGTLERDCYPTGWDETDWDIYETMREPRRRTFTEVGEELEIPWEQVRYRYQHLVTQCNVLSYFLPLGYYGYQYIIAIFKTDFEIGLVKNLKKLDRSSYIQKYKGEIILTAFLNPCPQAINTAEERFKELEEIGIIHDLRICIPIRSQNPLVDQF